MGIRISFQISQFFMFKKTTNDIRGDIHIFQIFIQHWLPPWKDTSKMSKRKTNENFNYQLGET